MLVVYLCTVDIYIKVQIEIQNIKYKLNTDTQLMFVGVEWL